MKSKDGPEMIVLPKGRKFYWKRSDEELQYIRVNASPLDDAGEPRVFSYQGSGFLLEDTVVAITRRRGIEWHGWGRKPPYLVEGIATINGIPRIICFQR